MTDDSIRSRRPADGDMEYLRVESIQKVSFVVALAPLGLLAAGMADPSLIDPRLGLIVILLSASALAGWSLSERWYSAAATLLIIGLIGSIAAATVAYKSSFLLFALPLVTSLVPPLLGNRPTVVVALGESALILALTQNGFMSAPLSEIVAMTALVVASTVLSVIAHQPLRTTLNWAWESYTKELAKTREVRERQEELAQLSKSLSEACERLEEANRALSHARRAAEETRRLKEEFVTSISHELRTPLNLIIGFSEMILRDAAAQRSTGGADWSCDFETIYRNACHLSDLIEDVLDLGQMEAQRLVLQKRWCDLAEIVGDAMTAVSGLYRKAELSLTVDLSPALPRVNVDPTRIRQILINLLTNAVRYTDEGGVRISARLDGHEVIISVSDTGLGIPPDDLPYVFESFRQTGQLKRRGGFGLGLTVSKRFAEMHGGAMWVVSNPNQGSTFSFSLPTIDNVAIAASDLRLRLIETHQGDGPNGTILVLDHDSQSAELFQRHLGECRVIAATSPQQVDQLATREKIDAVVVTSPDIARDDAFIRAAKQGIPGAPILRCSVRTLLRAGRELGAFSVLTKPVRSRTLRQTLRALKHRPRQILIIDDDESMIHLLAKMIRELLPHCQIQTTTSVERGLSLASADHPDLVLLDLLMPEVDGYAFLRTWTANPDLSTIPVVIVSAATEAHWRLTVGDSLELYRPGGLSFGDVLQLTRHTLRATALPVPAPS